MDSATESEPWSGSVSAKAPIFSILDMVAATAFCSSEPHFAIDCIASPACTAMNVPRLPSPRLSSMSTSPNDMAPMSAGRSP